MPHVAMAGTKSVRGRVFLQTPMRQGQCPRPAAPNQTHRSSSDGEILLFHRSGATTAHLSARCYSLMENRHVLVFASEVMLAAAFDNGRQQCRWRVRTWVLTRRRWRR